MFPAKDSKMWSHPLQIFAKAVFAILVFTPIRKLAFLEGHLQGGKILPGLLQPWGTTEIFLQHNLYHKAPKTRINKLAK